MGDYLTDYVKYSTRKNKPAVEIKTCITDATAHWFFEYPAVSKPLNFTVQAELEQATDKSHISA